jgi:hypothetical protein
VAKFWGSQLSVNKTLQAPELDRESQSLLGLRLLDLLLPDLVLTLIFEPVEVDLALPLPPPRGRGDTDLDKDLPLRRGGGDGDTECVLLATRGGDDRSRVRYGGVGGGVLSLREGGGGVIDRRRRGGGEAERESWRLRDRGGDGEREYEGDGERRRSLGGGDRRSLGGGDRRRGLLLLRPAPPRGGSL